MPKYLIEASYTLEGVKAVQSSGGTSRRDAIVELAESVGGRLESLYFAFGDHDVYVIVDLPDNESAAAAAFTVNSAGGAAVRTVVLLTPEEVDAAGEAIRRLPPARSLTSARHGQQQRGGEPNARNRAAPLRRHDGHWRPTSCHCCSCRRAARRSLHVGPVHSADAQVRLRARGGGHVRAAARSCRPASFAGSDAWISRGSRPGNKGLRYWRNDAIETLCGEGIPTLVAPDADRRKEPRPGRRGGRYDFARRVLASDWGKQLSLKRQGTVEPVFGQIKSNRGADRFQRRGRSAVRSEWRLLTATHNLLKLHRHQLATA